MIDSTKFDPAKGGRRRAERLSPARRKEIARKAAEARWGIEIPQAVYDGELHFGDLELPCAVLSDGTRVLTESNFMSALGMYRSGALSVRRGPKDRGARVPLYLAFKNIKPFVDKHLAGMHSEPLRYRTSSGNIAHGVRAAIIPRICEIWLDARKEGVLGKRQEEIAEKAEIIIRALAHVGIIALVDEATGYQDIRARDALAKILEEFVAKELRPWVRTFPAEFYQNLYRLRGLRFPDDNKSRPQYFGHLTNDIVYKRIAPGVLQELKRQTPRGDTGRHKQQLHRRLTEDVGHLKLREHLASVTTLMKISDTWDGFIRLLDKVHPRFNETLLLDLDEYSGSEGG